MWSDRPPASRPEVALHAEETGRPEAPADLTPSSRSGAPVPAPGADVAPAGLSGEAAPAPPEPSAGDEPLSAQAAVPTAGPGHAGLPIQEVLAQLHAEDAAKRIAETPSSPQVPFRQRRPTWDFMDDDPVVGDSGPGLPPAASSAGLPPAGAPSSAGFQGEYVDTRSRRAGGLPERWRAVRSALRNFWSGPAEPNPPLVIALALGVAVIAAVGLALYSGASSWPGGAAPSEARRGGDGVATGQAMDPFAAEAPDISAPEPETASSPGAMPGPAPVSGQRAYVAASLLSCREAPVLQARRVRNLGRGVEVQVLGRDGDWASLAYRGGQCWARAHFLSPVPPLEGR
ncbi:MAG TPA: hypothetical protein VF535_01075 [Allosphingosinicella sp.]